MHRLIEEGSARRRRLLDWGVFHVKHEFLRAWRRYQRALQQRNAALRDADVTEQLVAAWERELCVRRASPWTRCGASTSTQLQPYFVDVAEQLLGPERAVRLSPGLAGGPAISTQRSLEIARARPAAARRRPLGRIEPICRSSVEGAPARDRVSRGQQKLLAAAFILGQLAFRASARAPRDLPDAGRSGGRARCG